MNKSEIIKNKVFILITSYSQYPYKDCLKIPMKQQFVNGVTRYDVDKQWLYSHDFTNAVILLDEVKTLIISKIAKEIFIKRFPPIKKITYRYLTDVPSNFTHSFFKQSSLYFSLHIGYFSYSCF